MKKWPLVTTCVQVPMSRVQDLFDFDDSAREIKFSTFARYVNVREVEALLGYWPQLRLKDDRIVDYSKGTWRGRPAICLMWSRIHHIFQLPEEAHA